MPRARIAAGNRITPKGRLDEPYVSGNGPDHTNSRYVMTSRYHSSVRIRPSDSPRGSLGSALRMFTILWCSEHRNIDILLTVLYHRVLIVLGYISILFDIARVFAYWQVFYLYNTHTHTYTYICVYFYTKFKILENGTYFIGKFTYQQNAVFSSINLLNEMKKRPKRCFDKAACTSVQLPYHMQTRSITSHALFHWKTYAYTII